MELETLVATEEIRTHYKNRFRDRSLNRDPQRPPFQTKIKIGATTHTIRVAFRKLPEQHPDIPACNAINTQQNGSLVATIIVSSSIFKLSISEQKEILAHEYVEVLKAFQKGSRLKAVLGREGYVIFMALVESGRAPIFQDSQQDQADIERATEVLLVSKDSLLKILRQKNINDFDALVQLMLSSQEEAKAKVEQVANHFENELHTPRQIVKNRLYEIVRDLVSWGP